MRANDESTTKSTFYLNKRDITTDVAHSAVSPPPVLLLIRLACGQKSVKGREVMLGKSIERRKALNN